MSASIRGDLVGLQPHCSRLPIPARFLTSKRFLQDLPANFFAQRQTQLAMQAGDQPTELATAPVKAREEPCGMEAAAALLQAFAQVPSISKAWAFPATEGVRVSLQLSQRNLPSNSVRKYLTSLALNEATLEHGEADTALPVELGNAAMVAPSPSGRRTLVVRPGNGETSCMLEVWSRSAVVLDIHVPKALHGPCYNDGWFGSGAAWSPDERFVAYVAEGAPAVKTPEWGRRAKSGGKEGGKEAEGAGPKGWRGVGEFEEDWGELNAGKRPPSLFVLDCDTGQVVAVQGMPAGASSGQPQWSPDGAALVFVSWPHVAPNLSEFPQRLGIVYCFNRPCALHAVSWPRAAASGTAPRAAVRLTPAHLQSAFSPRFSPDGSTMVFLSQQAAVSSGVHNATCALHSLAWEPTAAALAAGSPGAMPEPRCVVDVVWSPPTPDAFPGLYCTVLPEQPFVGGSGTLALTTQWRSNTAVAVVDVASGRVTRATPANGASWAVVAAQGDWVLASESTPSQPFRLYACHLAGAQRGQPPTWSWSRLALPDAEQHPPAVAEALAQIEASVLQVTPTNGADKIVFEAVLLRRKDRPGPQPAVITPHGGPHTAYSAQYFIPLSFLVASGYAVVLINYRGSTGFGEACIQSLPGSIGTNDVADCMASLHAAAATGHVDSSRTAVIGGSHGGFLTAHLVGQHPAAFKAAVLRNPVCDLELMVHVTDIPDWCYVEAYGTEEGMKRAGGRPRAEDLARFAQVSPIAHADAVAAPVLMMLGGGDRRVPLDDGKQYIAAVRKRGAGAPATRQLVFPLDTHALDKPQTEFEQWLNALWWLNKHV